MWLPERAVYTRPLFFDYNSTAAVAVASFLSWHQGDGGAMVAPQAAQFLKAGQRVRRRCCLAESSCNARVHMFAETTPKRALRPHHLQAYFPPCGAAQLGV